MLQALRDRADSFEEAYKFGRPVTFVLSQPCRAGEEVFLNYGERDAFLMEASFGFAGSLPVALKNTTDCSLLKNIVTKSTPMFFQESWAMAKREILTRTC